MDWLRENWFWVALGVLFLWMHLKGHGGHGAQGGHSGHGGHGCCGGGGRPANDADRQGATRKGGSDAQR